eukprot:TRINITY_DN3504_c0_g1_i16.p1 TRINITY_DN3504_c0_g1~~TRINITY_DN3504_c0_g1_i16.p1  ORF type:complete len:392 (-),score=71.26 TRINITY_DN3504_c0_g1_i16:541-1716(-)
MKEMRKADEMRKLTEEFRREFKIPKPESVIQVYDCSMGGFNRGKLFVSQNFLCFSSTLTSRNVRLPYSRITSVQYETAIMSDKVIVMEDKKLLIFSGFGLKHAKEAYEIVLYLWQNPPNYIDLDTIDKYETTLSQATSSQGQQAQLNRPVVDVAAVDTLLSLALDASTTQNDAMVTIARQGEQIDRIGQKIETLEGKLQRADHLLRGIESYKYYMFGKQKGKDVQAREVSLKVQTLKLPPNTPPTIELDVLYKKPDDSLHPAILVLEAISFKCVCLQNHRLIDKGTEFNYEDLEAIVLRARHEHMDFRFKGTGNPRDRRFRVMSSYLQVIVNQVWSRCRKRNFNITVTFEPGVKKFEYKDDRVCVMPQATRDGAGDFVFFSLVLCILLFSI